MLIVAGLSLKNLQPRVWDPTSPFFLPALRAIMVSYADFVRRPAARQDAMTKGLRDYLQVPEHIQIYLDNGSFFMLRRQRKHPYEEYEHFVRSARPDWYPIPQDFIPLPRMAPERQEQCLRRTMHVNVSYRHDGFAPVIHFGARLDEYLAQFELDECLLQKPRIALGGLVPNLLRARKAHGYDRIVSGLRQVRARFPEKQLHVFGVGGTATLHLAALIGVDSVDSSGWRNRAARGIVRLAGSGDRLVTQLGSWRGRAPSADEWKRLDRCSCPACRRWGLQALKGSGILGFSHRACHNLAILLEEADWLEAAHRTGMYASTFEKRLNNSVYLPLLRRMLGAVA